VTLRRSHARIVAAGAIGSTIAFAFSCGSGGNSEAPGSTVDASVSDARSEASAVDSGADGADSAPAVDADDFAMGQRLIARPATLQGLTSDGYVVFSEAVGDAGAQVAEVIALDGGGETTIATGTAAEKTLRIDTNGPVVFVWTNRGNRIAMLTVWSKATGVVPVGAGIRPGRSAATSDGAFIAYVDNVTATTADVVVSAIASTSPTTVGTLNASDTSCWQDVDLEFAGTPPRFLSFFCPTPSAAFTVRSTATDGSGSTDLSSATTLETVGKNVVVVAGGDAGLQSFAPDGTNPVTLFAPGVAAFELSADESTVAFQTNDDSIQTSLIAVAGAHVAVPSGQGMQLGPISPDKNYVLFASALGDAGANQVAADTDVQLASTLDGGAIRALVSTITSCPGCLADSFTPDVTFAMAIDPIDNSETAGGVGPLHVFPLDGGADSRIGTNVYTVLALDAGSGASSQLLFVEGTPNAALSTGYAYELYTRSLGPSDMPTEIARGAELLAVDDARTVVVYSIPGDDDLAGVWVVPLP